VIPVYRVEVGEEYTGATVIEPNKGYVDCGYVMAAECDRSVVVAIIYYM